MDKIHYKITCVASKRSDIHPETLAKKFGTKYDWVLLDRLQKDKKKLSTKTLVRIFYAGEKYSWTDWGCVLSNFVDELMQRDDLTRSEYRKMFMEARHRDSYKLKSCFWARDERTLQD
ncbi:MAG: hypothetical protein U9M90_01050 [Patescibacteria group bacterium]|nr:hypothetical protein [Patescibacteria group bacterium]